MKRMRRIPKYQDSPNTFLGIAIALTLGGCFIIYYTSLVHKSSSLSWLSTKFTSGYEESHRISFEKRKIRNSMDFGTVDESHHRLDADGGYTHAITSGTRLEHELARRNEEELSKHVRAGNLQRQVFDKQQDKEIQINSSDVTTHQEYIDSGNHSVELGLASLSHNDDIQRDFQLQEQGRMTAQVNTNGAALRAQIVIPKMR